MTNLDEINEFSIELDGKERNVRYLVFLLEDAEGKTKRIMWNDNLSASYHRDLLPGLQKMTGELKVTCEGGGTLSVGYRGAMMLWDYSMDFGEDDKLKTIEILRRRFPEAEVEIHVPPH